MADLPLSQFEQEYFEKYFFNEDSKCFESYVNSWDKLSFVPHLVPALSLIEKNVSTALVFGSATGEVLNYFEINKIKARGIEISQFAFNNVLPNYTDKTFWGDVSIMFPQIYEKGQFFDLIFSSCFQFLHLSEIKKLLPLIKDNCYLFSHYGGYRGFGEDIMDLKLNICEDYNWWSKLFLDHGFYPTPSPYIWKTYRD